MYVNIPPATRVICHEGAVFCRFTQLRGHFSTRREIGALGGGALALPLRGVARGSIPGPPRRWAGLRRPSGSRMEPEQVRGHWTVTVTLRMS